MTTAKRQHFNPRLHLQHFAGTEPKGHVWTYDKRTGEVRHAIPEETAVERHFYSIKKSDGKIDTRIENFLSGVESMAAPIYESLLRDVVPKANTQLRADFATFLALTYVRTPAMRKTFADGLSRAIQIAGYVHPTNTEAFESITRSYEKEEGRVLSDEDKKRLRETLLDASDNVIEVPKERTLRALEAANELAPILFQMQWSLVFAAHGFFISTDNPLVRQVDHKSCHPMYGDHGFLNKTAEVLYPLSPKRLLLMTWNQSVRKIGFLSEAASIR